MQITGLSEIVASKKYEAWFLDQFGVLHDGKKAYPGAVEAVQKIAESGAKLVLISNSSKRAQKTVEKLPGLGFDPNLFSAIVTSGELTFLNLLKKSDPWFNALGRKCVHFTWSTRGAVSLDGLGLEVVENPHEADFLLAHGTEALGLADGTVVPASLGRMEEILLEASRNPRKLPLIVANPDIVTVEERDLRVMPGTLGQIYEGLGGEVKWMGKPGNLIYEACQLSLGGTAFSRCLAVGDSLLHDIQGSNRVGMDSVFVAGGIHAQELGVHAPGDQVNVEALRKLLERGEGTPTFVISSFVW